MNMATLPDLFVHIQPFRSCLLSLLRPFDIARLQDAIGCKLSIWEREKYMNILDDIFENSAVIKQLVAAGLTIRIFGADFERLESRLQQPRVHDIPFRQTYRLFVLVSDSYNKDKSGSTLVRDYRQSTEQGFVPDDLSMAELRARFDTSVATQIANFSRWILCAPYLLGTMPNEVPGWIPLLLARSHVDVRAYISTYNDCNGKILHMDRHLIRQVFGFQTNEGLLSNLSSLSTVCCTMSTHGTKVERLRGCLNMNFLHNLLVSSENPKSTSYVVVHTLHSSSCCITLNLQ